MIAYLSLEQVLALHKEQLARYGGATGLRDRGGLESALARPAMTFGGEDLYADIASKAVTSSTRLKRDPAFLCIVPLPFA